MTGEVLYYYHAIMLSLGPGLPLLLALASCSPTMRQSVARLCPWAVLPALIGGFIVPRELVVQVGWFFMGGRMGLDATGQVFYCVTAFIWFLAGISIAGRSIEETVSPRFMGFFLAAMSGNFGLILAQDMLGFYLFFALMSLATYGLVIDRQTEEAKRAGWVYLILVILGEVAIFAALILLADTTRSTAIADIGRAELHSIVLVLLFLGFGVKIGVLPVHVWKPLAYQNAPLPAAVVLAGAMVNGGLLGWLRFLPLGRASHPSGAMLFIIAGALAAFFGVVIGLGQKRPRVVLAYSSISQMGLISIITGLGLLTPETGQYAVGVLTMYGVHHSLAKSSLFLGLVGPKAADGSTNRRRIAGMLLPALALAGLPFTSGAIAKTAFKELTVLAGDPWHGVYAILLPLASCSTTLLMLHFLRLLLREPSEETKFAPYGQKAWIISLAAVATTLWLWPAARIPAYRSFIPVALWQSLWPVMIGCLALYVWKKAARDRIVLYSVPEGDILVWYERCVHFLIRFCRAVATGIHVQEIWRKKERLHWITHAGRVYPRLRKDEKILGRWSVVGFCYLALCSILLYLLG